MLSLDQAIDKLRDNPQDADTRHAFYDLFLNSVLYVPTYDDEIKGVAKESKGEDTLPLILQVDGIQYMVMFDSQEKLKAWAEEDVHCLALPGYLLAEMSNEKLYWSLNANSKHQKQFVPEEIAWLKEVVLNARAVANEKGDASFC